MSDPSPIGDRPITTPIHCIYFYYVRYPLDDEQHQNPTITLYYHSEEFTPIDEAALMFLIKKLALNARHDDYTPPPCGDGFSAVPWRKRSYIVVLLDDSEQLSSANALHIDFQGPVVEEFNHSFFNARKRDIDLPGGTVTAISCVNLMLNMDGRELLEGEREKFDVSCQPSNYPALRFDGDDGGTNQGGPIPPLMDF